MSVQDTKDDENTTQVTEEVENTQVTEDNAPQDDSTIVDGEELTLEEVNEIMLPFIKKHSEELVFDEEYFLDLLMHSLSLTLSEKKRVVDAIPTLSETQVEDLIHVFLGERDDFRGLAQEHPEDIKILLKRQQKEWIELGMIYKNIAEKENSSSEDEQKIEDIKASLGL